MSGGYNLSPDSVVEVMLKTPRESWVKYFNGQLRPHLSYAMTNILKSRERITPQYQVILRCFSFFDVERTRVVVLGQDPYPTPGVATGLAFECMGQTKQPSLRNIRSALGEQDLDFEGAARSGVLFMNAALTTIEKKTEAHTSLWKPFVQSVIALINATVQDEVYYLLWGQKAQDLAQPLITNPNHKVLKWSHPSPMADNMITDTAKKFKNCDHFKVCGFIDWVKSEKKFSNIIELPHIEEFEKHVREDVAKNPQLAITTQYVLANQEYINYYIRWMKRAFPEEGDQVEVWTDGSATRNGRPDAQAGWGYAIYLPGGTTPINTDCGRVAGGQTNSRAELQAVVEALKKLEPRQRAILYTDSQYVKDIIEGTKAAHVNLDLMDEFGRYSEYIIKVVWIRGHTGLHDKNTLADQLANAGRVGSTPPL